VFLLVPAYPGCHGPKAVKQFLLLFRDIHSGMSPCSTLGCDFFKWLIRTVHLTFNSF